MIPARQATSEGAELNFAVHHLAPYSMTSKLLPLLARRAGRVVNVNSEGHRAPLSGGGAVRIDFEEELLDHSPAAHVRRPRLDYESHATALDRNELGAILVAAGLEPPAEHALASLLALNGLRVSEATGADIEHMGTECGHRTLVITRKGGKSSDGQAVLTQLRSPLVTNGAIANRRSASPGLYWRSSLRGIRSRCSALPSALLSMDPNSSARSPQRLPGAPGHPRKPPTCCSSARHDQIGISPVSWPRRSNENQLRSITQVPQRALRSIDTHNAAG
jgi:hypothetical protein